MATQTLPSAEINTSPISAVLSSPSLSGIPGGGGMIHPSSSHVTGVVPPSAPTPSNINASTSGATVSQSSIHSNPSTYPSLYVGDLDPSVNEVILHEIFSHVGHVMSIRICRDRISRNSLGYGYVNYDNFQDAERALDTLNYHPINGRQIRVMWCHRDPRLRKSGNGNIFVKNLPKSVDNKALHDLFSIYGNILSCKVAYSDDSTSKGFGFVHYDAEEAALKSIKALNNTKIEDNIIYVGNFIKRSDRAQNETKYTNLYVKNFPSEWDENSLQDVFKPFGNVTSLAIRSNSKQQKFAHVNFENTEQAQEAVVELHGRNIVDGSISFDTPANPTIFDDTETSKQEEYLYVAPHQEKSQRQAYLKAKHNNSNTPNGSIKNRNVVANLYVKNFDSSIDDDVMRSMFSVFGPITSCVVMRDERGGHLGYGFVNYVSHEDAVKAVREMHNKSINGKPLYVSLYEQKDARRRRLGSSINNSNNRPQATNFGGATGGLMPTYAASPLGYGNSGLAIAGGHPHHLAGPPHHPHMPNMQPPTATLGYHGRQIMGHQPPPPPPSHHPTAHHTHPQQAIAPPPHQQHPMPPVPHHHQSQPQTAYNTGLIQWRSPPPPPSHGSVPTQQQNTAQAASHTNYPSTIPSISSQQQQQLTNQNSNVPTTPPSSSSQLRTSPSQQQTGNPNNNTSMNSMFTSHNNPPPPPPPVNIPSGLLKSNIAGQPVVNLNVMVGSPPTINQPNSSGTTLPPQPNGSTMAYPTPSAQPNSGFSPQQNTSNFFTGGPHTQQQQLSQHSSSDHQNPSVNINSANRNSPFIMTGMNSGTSQPSPANESPNTSLNSISGQQANSLPSSSSPNNSTSSHIIHTQNNNAGVRTFPQQGSNQSPSMVGANNMVGMGTMATSGVMGKVQHTQQHGGSNNPNFKNLVGNYKFTSRNQLEHTHGQQQGTQQQQHISISYPSSGNNNVNAHPQHESISNASLVHPPVQQPPQSNENVPSLQHTQNSNTITMSQLASMPSTNQKQYLGEQLFFRITKYYPDLAGKITGMMLEMDNEELLGLLNSETQLQSKVQEAMRVLETHQTTAA